LWRAHRSPAWQPGDHGDGTLGAMTEPAPLSRREPRPFPLHWLVDSAVAFLAIVLVALMWEIGLGAIVIAALVMGLVAAPFTRNLEAKALAAREASSDGGD
jgi:hypothetical protein